MDEYRMVRPFATRTRRRRFVARCILWALAGVLLTQVRAFAAADLAVTASADRLSVQPGTSGADLVNFTIGLTNAGPEPADAVVVSRLPAGLRIPAGMSAEPSVGTYEPATGRWDVGVLSDGAAATLFIPAQAIGGAAGCLVNTATASLAAGSGTADPDVTNDTASATVGAPVCADLAVTSVRSNEATVNCFDANQTFRVTNGGPNTATNVRLVITRYEITAPAGFSEASCTTGSVVVPGPTTVTIGTVTAGQTRQFDTGLQNLQRSGPDITVAFAVNAVATEPDPDAANSAASGTYVVDRSGGFGTSTGTVCIAASMLGGTPFADLIPRLREFRDRYLMTSGIGRAFVAGYYRISPPLTEYFGRHGILREVAGWLLGLAVKLFIIAVDQPVPMAGLALLALLALRAWPKYAHTLRLAAGRGKAPGSRQPWPSKAPAQVCQRGDAL